MSMAERIEFDRQKNKRFQERVSKINFSDEKYHFPFIQYPENEKKTSIKNTRDSFRSGSGRKILDIELNHKPRYR
jgi:hypothetical protein